MPTFSIVPFRDRASVIDFVGEDSGDVLNIMQRRGCRHADIFRDGAYLLSARLAETEVWSIYRGTDLNSTANAEPTHVPNTQSSLGTRRQ